MNQPKILSLDAALELQAAHQQRAQALTADHVARRAAGEHHPVYDFLYEYYPIRPSHLRRWHPGLGVAIPLDKRLPQSGWRYYQTTAATEFAPQSPGQVVNASSSEFLAHKGQTVGYIANLLCRTETNPVHFDCFGLHEWAMVYRTDKPRHQLPLRLGAAGTDAVVESHNIRCTHMDAYRFFTPPALPLNFTVLNREDQPTKEQRACLHAGMDLYKWASKLVPMIPGDLWLDTFELARDIRVLDMEASPYDCRALGFGVVAIETSEGKAEYVARQRAFAERATVLRARILDVISPLLIKADS